MNEGLNQQTIKLKVSSSSAKLNVTLNPPRPGRAPARGWFAFHWEKRLWVLENQPSESRDHILSELRWCRWNENHLTRSPKALLILPSLGNTTSLVPKQITFICRETVICIGPVRTRDQHQYSVLIWELQSMTFNLKQERKVGGPLYYTTRALSWGFSTISWGLCDKEVVISLLYPEEPMLG